MLTGIIYNNLTINYVTLLTLVFIGFSLKRSGFIKEEYSIFLNNLSLKIILPMFVVTSFMQDTDPDLMTSGIPILTWGIFIHLILLSVAYFHYKYDHELSKDNKILLQNILPMGASSSFGVAAAVAFFGIDGAFVGNVYNISLRLFLYTICFVSISGIAFTKKNIFNIFANPTILCSIFGMIVFFLQDQTPQITINGITRSVLRLDHVAPFFFIPIKQLGMMYPPLVWLIIGSSISQEIITIIRTSPIVRKFIIDKCIMIPIVTVILYILIHRLGFQMDARIVPIVLLMQLAPPANVLISAALTYRRSEKLGMACFLSCTVVCIFLLPIYYTILQTLFN